MPANHVLLQRVTVTAPVSSISFSSIPQTGYTDLKIVISGRDSSSVNTSNAGYSFTIYPNGASTNITQRSIFANGSTVAGYTDTQMYTAIEMNADTAKAYNNVEIYCPNYASANPKSFSIDSVTEHNGAAATRIAAGLWNSTAAITSLQFNAYSTWMEGSSFSLYGVVNAATTPALAPKADGGDIIKTDGTYWYHAFTGSGIFRPQLNLTCDVLMISGGGGGSNQGGIGAGGGAGAVHYSTSNTFTTSPITITVGAGGTQDLTSSGPGQAGSLSGFSSTTTSVSNGALGGPGTGGVGGASKSVISGTTTNYTGGATSGTEPNRAGGGGAGIGANGGNASSGSYGGSGGAGLNTWSSWLTATGTGVSGYIGGGGGGGFEYNGSRSRTPGGAGGGGEGGAGTSAPNYNGLAGTANTGSGGGGAGGRSGVIGGASGAGGSGLVIIRYPV